MKCATVACVKHERPHAVSSEQQSHSCLSLFLTGFMRISVAKDRRGSGTLWPTLNSFLKLLSHSFIKISVKYLFIQTVVTVTECVVSISTLFSCSVKTLFWSPGPVYPIRTEISTKRRSDCEPTESRILLFYCYCLSGDYRSRCMWWLRESGG